MFYLTAISLAKEQQDITHEEWCNLYVRYQNPSDEQIALASKTAHEILVRNDVIDESVQFAYVR